MGFPYNNEPNVVPRAVVGLHQLPPPFSPAYLILGREAVALVSDVRMIL